MKKKSRFPFATVILLVLVIIVLAILVIMNPTLRGRIEGSIKNEPETTVAEAVTEPETTTQAPTEAETTTAEQPTGTTVDTGFMKTMCPSDWLYIEQKNMFAEADENGDYPIDPETMVFAKGASTELDAAYKLTIYAYYVQQEITDTTISNNKMWYDESEDISVTINGVECRAFHARSADLQEENAYYEYDIVFYPIDADNNQWFQFNIMLSSPAVDDKISIDDADVQTILSNMVLD